MSRITSVLAFRVKEGRSDDARQEINNIMETVRGQGGEPYLNWVTGGQTTPGGLVLHLVWPDAKTYATALASGQNQFFISQARGESALDVSALGLEEEVPDTGS